MPWDQPRLTRLREILAELYESEADQRRIAADAGLRTAAVPFERTAQNSWFNILRHANRLDRVDDIVKIARKEFPRHAGLAEVAETEATPAAPAGRPLRHPEILELHSTLISAGLDRMTLLSGIDRQVVASLPVRSNPSEQWLCDLGVLNGIPSLLDGSTPLVTFLTNALALLGQRSEAKTFQRALAIVSPSAPPSSLEAKTRAASSEPATVDIAILTAIQVEREAVNAALGFTSANRIKRAGRTYWCGKLDLPSGGSYEIAVAQPVDMGQVEAALLASEVLQHWKPRAVFLVGIAASAKAGVSLGDVVVGRSVLYYEHGKVNAGGIAPQPEMIPADAGLLKHVVGLPPWDGSVPVPRPDGTDKRPKVHSGVIASGEKVVADEAARDEIAGAHRKILAIEMEGYGFSRAVSQVRVPHLDVRGICDEGSAAKDDAWHGYAAAVAAGFVRHLILDGPIKVGSRMT